MSEMHRILIIDDEEVVLDSCREILRGNDYSITTALNGEQGLKLLQEFNPDLVFIDLKMPGMSGLEVLAEIREFDPNIVTVVITGFATISSAVDAMKLGTLDFLPKPFTPDEFRLITRRALEKRKLILETIELRREKEMLRSNFAAIVSHELKSPLSAVQQNLYVLSADLKDKVNEDQRASLERMKARIDELLELIRTWLRIISVDLKTIEEKFKPLQLESLISAAVESVQHQAVRKDIELLVDIDTPLNSVIGDAGTLTEVIVNILNNAIKYSYPGSIVRCTAGNHEEEVTLSISDNGIGISADDLPYIFNDFYRGKNGQQEEKGFGFGLALSSRILEIHDGSISVESEIGKGSTFQISLPARLGDTQTHKPLKAGVASPQVEGEQL
jgi:two-component system sensor histidine kinase/response regulator